MAVAKTALRKERSNEEIRNCKSTFVLEKGNGSSRRNDCYRAAAERQRVRRRTANKGRHRNSEVPECLRADRGRPVATILGTRRSPGQRSLRCERRESALYRRPSDS